MSDDRSIIIEKIPVSFFKSGVSEKRGSSSDYPKTAIDSQQLQTNQNVIYLLGNHFNIREKSRPLETPSINYPHLFPPHPFLSSLRSCPFPTEAIILQDVNTSSRAQKKDQPIEIF